MEFLNTTEYKVALPLTITALSLLSLAMIDYAALTPLNRELVYYTIIFSSTIMSTVSIFFLHFKEKDKNYTILAKALIPSIIFLIVIPGSSLANHYMTPTSSEIIRFILCCIALLYGLIYYKEG